MASTTRLLTAEEFALLASDVKCELIDGMVVEMPPAGYEHGVIAATVALILGAHVRANRLGRVTTEIGFILRRNPDVVRAPDVGFLKLERIPLPDQRSSYVEGPPDLAFEVVSPSDRPGEVQTKLREWIEAGASAVVLLYPATRTAHVVRSLVNRIELVADDMLDLSDIVPGFICRVSELFEDI
jgi:Uma2 family endonuclease